MVSSFPRPLGALFAGAVLATSGAACDDSSRAAVPGALLWVQNLAATDASPVSLTLDEGGNIYVGALNEGIGTFKRPDGIAPGSECAATPYLVLARYRLDEGDEADPVKHSWSMAFCDGTYTSPQLPLTHSRLRTTVAVGFEGAIDFGSGSSIDGGTSASPGGAVVSFDDATGGYVWGVPLNGQPIAIESRGDNNLALLSNRGANPSSEDPQIVVSLLSESDGTALWTQGFGDPTQNVRGGTLAVDSSSSPEGEVFVSGSFSNTLLIGSPLASDPDANARFVAKLRGSDGAALWGRRFAEGDGAALQLATTSTGDVVVAGIFVEDITGTPSNQLFVFILDGETGMPVLERRVGDAAGASVLSVSGVTTDNSDNMVLTGTFQGQYTIGLRELASSDAPAMYIAKLEPALGDPLWSFPSEGTGTVETSGVLTDGADNVLTTGTFEESVGQPDQPKEIYFLKLSP